MSISKESAILKLNSVKEEIYSVELIDLSSFKYKLKKAFEIGENAPLRIITTLDGRQITNKLERELILNTLDYEIGIIRHVSEETLEQYKQQITFTLAMLMVSISEFISGFHPG